MYLHLNIALNNFINSENSVFIFFYYILLLQGLAEYLRKNGRGKEILKEYNNNNQFLKPTTRSKLVRLVVTREKEWQLRNISPENQLSKFE